MTELETLFKKITQNKFLDIDIIHTVNWFISRMHKERRINEISVTFIQEALKNLKIEDVKLLLTTYYFPNSLKYNEYYYAMRILSLYLSSIIDTRFDNNRLNIIKDFIDSGDRFLDKEYRTLFMYDLHLLFKSDEDIEFYSQTIDYKELIAFLNLNNMGFHEYFFKETFTGRAFRYQLNYLKNFIANSNKRLIR